MNGKQALSRVIETLMASIVERSVEVEFSPLGKNKDYSITVQTTLYEFDDNDNGPKGPMYLTLNIQLLQDTERLLKVLNEIAAIRR